MNWEQPKSFAVKHKDSEVIAYSRSGGFFTALSDLVLESGGVVYGCVLDENYNAIHIRANNYECRNKMRGSKYIQSKMGDTFKNVKNDLENHIMVLFSGTSCQIAGLRAYLNKNYDELICVDILCHGVPSKVVWKKYLDWQENKSSSKISGINFRNKYKYGWHKHVETIQFENGKSVDSKVYARLFMGNNMLRPSCYECKYKSFEHPGDITIGDYWGIEKVASEFNDNKGVSLILINNEKGNKLFDSLKNQINFKETELRLSKQSALIAPTKRPKTREKFWIDFEKKSFDYIVIKYVIQYIEKAIIKKIIKNKII